MKTIILLGMGYANLCFVKRWATSPVTDCRLVCVSDRQSATYSGMLPGILAGQFQPSQAEIDLADFVGRCGGDLIVADSERIDSRSQTIHLRGQPEIKFDVLSVGVGSIASRVETFDESIAVPLKPLSDFIQRFNSLVNEKQKLSTRRRFRICVVGGMAAIEILLCLPQHLKVTHPNLLFELELICKGEAICKGLSLQSYLKLEQILQKRGVAIRKDVHVTQMNKDGFVAASGEQFQADCVVWSTRPAPPVILKHLGLPLDQNGFISTHATLKTIADLPVFASGDSGSIVDIPLPKSGVIAVRQAPLLWENVNRFLKGRELVEFRTNAHSLKLINTGDGRALLDYRGLSYHGRICWWLKKRIDQRFVGGFKEFKNN